MVANYRAVQTLVGPDVAVLAVVKADAYGHGVVPVARALSDAGAFGFGVALAEEGLELRDAGVKGTILVLNGVHGAAHREVLDADLTPVVYAWNELRAFASAAKGASFGVHVKVDTGMSRLGVRVDKLESFLGELRALPGVRIDGVMTHLAAADTDPEFTTHQLKEFERAVSLISRFGHRPRWIHAANSAGCLRADARFNLVRPGILLYGVAPSSSSELDLRLALRIRSEIIALRSLNAGETVGYERTWRAPSGGAVIATIPFGYGDGLVWRASGRLEALVHGVRCPVVGRISMDLTTVDVTPLANVAVGDEVVLLGSQGTETIRPEEWAAASGTIPYEVLTNISRRVPRVHR